MNQLACKSVAIYGTPANAVRCRCCERDYLDKGIRSMSPYCGSGLYVSLVTICLYLVYLKLMRFLERSSIFAFIILSSTRMA